MKRFYSIEELRSIFGQDFELPNAHAYIDQTSDSQLREFLVAITNSSATLFFGWIQQINGLEEFLVTKKATIPFSDTSKLLEHTLINEFKRFISPFLYPLILRNLEGENSLIAATFIQVLDKDTRGIVEQEIYKFITPGFKKIHQTFEEKIGEEKLIVYVQGIVNDDTIHLINLFSRTSYALKMDYVEHVLNIINSKSCTTRLANWLLKQLEKIELNPEHQSKITELRSDLKTGNMSVRNRNTHSRASIPFRLIIFSIVSLALISLAIWLIVEKPWSDSDEPIIASNSSFIEFTQEERKQIDSLLLEIQPKRKIPQEELDLGTYINQSKTIDIRNPFENKIAEQYYTDLKLVATHYDDLKSDSCVSFSSKKSKSIVLPKMLDMSNKTNGNKALIDNQSDYDVQLLVFNDQINAPVYYAYVPKKSSITLLLDLNECIMTVAGNSFQNFTIPKNYGGPKPSANYSYHFCEMDVNLMNSIGTSYYLENKKSSYKFLMVGTQTEVFELIDLYGALEQY